jgi:hypothetical protein
MLALTVARNGSVRPVDDQTRIQKGDRVTLLFTAQQADAVSERLSGFGWVPDEVPAAVEMTEA